MSLSPLRLSPCSQRLRRLRIGSRILEKLGEISPKRVGHPFKEVNASIDRLALDAADVGSVHLRLTGEILLGHAPRRTKSAQIPGDAGAALHGPHATGLSAAKPWNIFDILAPRRRRSPGRQLMAGIASIAPAIRRAVSRFAIPFVGAGAIALATAISLSPSATFAAEPVADCQVFKTQLPDFAAMQPPPVVFKRGGAGWSYGHRLADQLTDVPMTEETRESLGYASFVVGVAVNGGRDVQFFWSDGLNPKLCGFGRPLVLPIARVRELEGPHLPSPYANGDRGKLAEVPTPRFDQPDQALGGSRGDESDDGDGDVFPPEMMTLQERNSLAQIATGVVAYGESAEQCFYEAAVGPAIRAIDDRYQSQYGSFWPVLKRQSQGAANILGNMAKLYTPEAAVRNGRAGPQLNAAQSRCRAAGLAVPFALMAAQGVVGFQTELLDASDRLMSGKGRPR